MNKYPMRAVHVNKILNELLKGDDAPPGLLAIVIEGIDGRSFNVHDVFQNGDRGITLMCREAEEE